MSESLSAFFYLVASVCFIMALRGLSSPDTARGGNIYGIAGMAIAILGALLTRGMTYNWIIVGLVLGALIGLPLAIFMPMKDVPQRTALSHSLGALAACLVGVAEFVRFEDMTSVRLTALDFEVIVGNLTDKFTLEAAPGEAQRRGQRQTRK